MALTRLRPLIDNLSILTKSRRAARLATVYKPAQLALLDHTESCLKSGTPTRVIILKARQMGMSTMVEAIMFAFSMSWMHWQGLIVSQDTDASRKLLAMTQYFYDTYPYAPLYKQTGRAQGKLAWEPISTELTIAPSKRLGAGRGWTLQALHASEVGFWVHGGTLMGGLGESIHPEPGTFIALESTANGVGNYFHNSWVQAEEGEGDFTPLFFSWVLDPDYRNSRLPNREHIRFTDPDEEERLLFSLLKRGVNTRSTKIPAMSPDDIRDALLWRRWKIANKPQDDVRSPTDFFHQEFPTIPEEAFLFTGTNIFDPRHLAAAYRPIRFWRGDIQGRNLLKSSNGDLRIYRKPKPGEEYTIAADPTFTSGRHQSDWSCLQVINRRTYEQVATFRSKSVAPNRLANKMMDLGKYYNMALLAPERKGGGLGVVAVLLEANYPNIYRQHKKARTPGQIQDMYGWESNIDTKNEAVGHLVSMLDLRHDAVNRGSNTGIIIHDDHTNREMKGYIRRENGELGNSNEAEYDDTVDALAIAVAVTRHESVFLTPRSSPSHPPARAQIGDGAPMPV